MSTSLRAELERRPLSTHQITAISLDVASALLYLHLMQPDPVMHRDISNANVLLNPGPNDSWLAKVSDYGSANYLRQVTTRSPGNPSYAAPEASIPTQQTTKMDMYSYRVLLLEMWSQKFPEKAEHTALLLGLEQDDVREVVQRCLQQDQLLRPEMKDIVEELQEKYFMSLILMYAVYIYIYLDLFKVHSNGSISYWKPLHSKTCKCSHAKDTLCKNGNVRMLCSLD